MTDEAKIEIITRLLMWFNREDNKKNFKYCGDGMCLILYHVTETEEDEFQKWLMTTTKRRWQNTNYFFKPGNIQPRVNHLNKLLKQLTT